MIAGPEPTINVDMRHLPIENKNPRIRLKRLAFVVRSLNRQRDCS
jgi:hypothetical protein